MPSEYTTPQRASPPVLGLQGHHGQEVAQLPADRLGIDRGVAPGPRSRNRRPPGLPLDEPATMFSTASAPKPHVAGDDVVLVVSPTGQRQQHPACLVADHGA
jgi:hypothetical protein